MLNKLKYYPMWLSVSNTNACPVKSDKCIPCGFLLTFILHHLLWFPSVISCCAILLPSSYITNDSRQHTCLAVTQALCALSDDSATCTSVVYSVPLTHRCNSMRLKNTSHPYLSYLLLLGFTENSHSAFNFSLLWAELSCVALRVH